MRVLIIDDNPDIRQLHSRVLWLMGHEACCLPDGHHALEAAKRFQPDLVLLDVCMPGIDGWDVAVQLRADPVTEHIRIVAITAMTSPECEKRSQEAGIDAHYRKPIAAAEWPRILAASSSDNAR
jgi:CheY-like chemotaxis protein